MSDVVLVVVIAVVLGWGAWLLAKRRSRQRVNTFLKDRGGRQCPACRQYVSQVAQVCRSCGHRFDVKEEEEAKPR